jgi:hypothetical protein
MTQEFYSVVLKKKINIPKDKIKLVTKKGRKFLVGIYKIGNKDYEAWRIVGKNYIHK